MPEKAGKRLQFMVLLWTVFRQMREEVWGDFGEVFTELTRRLVEEGQRVGLTIDEIIELIEKLMPLIELIVEILLGLFAKPQ